MGARPAPGTTPLWLLARRLSSEAARRWLREQARKKGRTPSQASLVPAGFVPVVSDLGTGTCRTERVEAGYRLRWQIELACKRLEHVLELNEGRARESALAPVYLLGKLLAAVQVAGRSWTWAHIVWTDWFATRKRPVSPWR